MHASLQQKVSKKGSVFHGEAAADGELTVVKSLSSCPGFIVFDSNQKTGEDRGRELQSRRNHKLAISKRRQNSV